MENTQEQKTPEQWFQMLKEPYRSQAIANIVDNRPVLSLNSALECQNAWKLTPQGFAYWNYIAVSIKAGETTYLEHETVTPEPIELRTEDLVSGEVYTFSMPENDWKWTFKFKGLNLEKIHDQIEYYILYVHHDKKIIFNSSCSHREKYYHATPEEKKLLLGEEEPTDWKSMYHELTRTCNELTQIIADLKSELAEKYNKQEPKGEKVYFFSDIEEKIWGKVTDKLVAIEFSRDNYEIYEAVCIGKKKSVLVNETT